MRFTILICLFAIGCNHQYQIRGGPNNQTRITKHDDLADQLMPMVAASPNASARLRSVRSDKRTAKMLLYAQIATLLPCILLAPSENTGVVIGTCGASIGFGVGSLIYQPGKGDYANVLRAYNYDFPAHPYSSPELNVVAQPTIPPSTATVPQRPRN